LAVSSEERERLERTPGKKPGMKLLSLTVTLAVAIGVSACGDSDRQKVQTSRTAETPPTGRDGGSPPSTAPTPPCSADIERAQKMQKALKRYSRCVDKARAENNPQEIGKCAQEIQKIQQESSDQ
jgi:hypothetical protein